MPAPEDLKAYDDVAPGLANQIVGMAQKSLDAQVAVQVVPIRAEARALIIATSAASLLPYLAIIAAVVLAVLGYDVAAVISGIVGVVSIGPKLIEAVRKKY